MNTNSRHRRLAAGISLAVLSVASAASAQPLANPLIPSSARTADVEVVPNGLRPRVGVQVGVTDNVTSTNVNKQSDTIGRLSVGADGVYSSPRAKLYVNGDVLYDVYAKNKKYDSLSANGTLGAAYIIAPEVLAIEAAGTQTQGSLSTFGSTDFFRAANANDYRFGTYFVGPHLTLSPGIFDVSAAARYGQAFFDSRGSATTQALDSTTSFYQLIGAADTKDRLGRVRFVTSAQYQADNRDFESTSGSVSSFFQATDRFTGILRLGYDDTQLNAAQDNKAPFWSVGGQYLFGNESYLRIEGGQRYDAPYFAGDLQYKASRIFTLQANYTVTQSPGAIAINNVLVDYVGGLDQPLPFAGTPGAFALNTTYFNEPSLNRTGRVAANIDMGRQQVALSLTSVEQKFETNTQDFQTLSQDLTYTNQVRPDLRLVFAFLHANGSGYRLLGADNEGQYYQTTAGADYGINSRTKMAFRYVNRRFRADGAGTISDFDENIGSLALIRLF